MRHGYVRLRCADPTRLHRMSLYVHRDDWSRMPNMRAMNNRSTLVAAVRSARDIRARICTIFFSSRKCLACVSIHCTICIIRASDARHSCRDRRWIHLPTFERRFMLVVRPMLEACVSGERED